MCMPHEVYISRIISINIIMYLRSVADVHCAEYPGFAHFMWYHII